MTVGKSPEIQTSPISVSESPSVSIPSSETRVQRRGFLKRTFGALVVGTGLVNLTSKSASAETEKPKSILFPSDSSSDPLPEEKPQPSLDSKNRSQENKEAAMAAVAAEIVAKPKPELPRSLSDSINAKRQIAENFLMQIPGDASPSIEIELFSGDETLVSRVSGEKVISENPRQVTINNPYLNITYPANNPSSEKSVVRAVCHELTGLILESNRDKPLIADFSESLWQYSGINLDTIAAKTAPESEVKKFRMMIDHFNWGEFDLSKIRKTDGIARPLFIDFFSEFLEDPTGLPAKIEKAPPEIKLGMANGFLEVLTQAMNCAKPGTTLSSVGLNRSGIEKIIATSQNSRHKQFFDKIAA